MSLRSLLSLLVAFALGACSTSSMQAREPVPAASLTAPEPSEHESAVEAEEEPSLAASETEPAQEEEPQPPEPEPVEVVAGRALGPIQIGMSEEDVRALGLEESDGDWQSRRFGPYRVYFRRGVVHRIEARIGDLGRIRFGEHVFAAGTHIHTLRDAFGECRWYEGGGERYRCAGGTLFVHTAHTMDPARYMIAVEGRD